jgi:CheY-like chemotaxis protein
MTKDSNVDTIKILIIEDNESDAVLVQHLLESPENSKFKCSSAESILESIELLKKESFDLVILDLNLPDGKGFNTFSQIKELVPDLPILILSGSTMKREEFRHCLDSAENYLVKGYLDSATLTETIMKALNEKKSI